jgi:uncharacterized DUF497 family protein
VKFVWDIRKNETNIKKHKISFYQASNVFRDLNSITQFDFGHSENESRYLVIGMTQEGLLTVVFVERTENVVRIISARRATKKERNLYEEKNQS